MSRLTKIVSAILFMLFAISCGSPQVRQVDRNQVDQSERQTQQDLRDK